MMLMMEKCFNVKDEDGLGSDVDVIIIQFKQQVFNSRP